MAADVMRRAACGSGAGPSTGPMLRSHSPTLVAQEHAAWVAAVELDLGDPGGDALLAGLQDEARQRLPLADLRHRVAVTATAPNQQ